MGLSLVPSSGWLGDPGDALDGSIEEGIGRIDPGRSLRKPVGLLLDDGCCVSAGLTSSTLSFVGTLLLLLLLMVSFRLSLFSSTGRTKMHRSSKLLLLSTADFRLLTLLLLCEPFRRVLPPVEPLLKSKEGI